MIYQVAFFTMTEEWAYWTGKGWSVYRSKAKMMDRKEAEEVLLEKRRESLMAEMTAQMLKPDEQPVFGDQRRVKVRR